MKEKQGNQPNSYGKLMKRMLIYLGIGGVCGFFVGIFMTFGVKNGMSDLSDLVRPLAVQKFIRTRRAGSDEEGHRAGTADHCGNFRCKHCPDGILQPEIKGYDEASRRSRG